MELYLALLQLLPILLSVMMARELLQVPGKFFSSLAIKCQRQIKIEVRNVLQKLLNW
jgi:hypothetical protein